MSIKTHDLDFESDLMALVDSFGLVRLTEEAQFLVFRLGTAEVPARPETLESFKTYVEGFFKAHNIEIPFMVVSSLVRLTAVSTVSYESE